MVLLNDELAARGAEMTERIFTAARPGAVFAEPVRNGDVVVIAASEVFSAGGFGMGSGSGPAEVTGATESVPQGSGGGGGGAARGRPVAVVEVTPSGVRVEPIVDVTKLGLAAFAVGLSLTAALFRLRRASRG
jgi:uncharacterized spore protein YtfJ